MKYLKISLLIFIGTILLYSIIILFTPFGNTIGDKREEIKNLNILKNEPENKTSYNKLFILYMKKEDFKNAIEIKKRQLRAFPSNADGYVWIAYLLIEIDTVDISYKDSVLKYLNKAYNLSNGDVTLLTWIGEIYKRINEDSLALIIFNKALTKFNYDSIIRQDYYKLTKERILENIKEVKYGKTYNIDSNVSDSIKTPSGEIIIEVTPGERAKFIIKEGF